MIWPGLLVRRFTCLRCLLAFPVLAGFALLSALSSLLDFSSHLLLFFYDLILFAVIIFFFLIAFCLQFLLFTF